MKKAKLIVPVILLAAAISAYGVNLQSQGFDVTGTTQQGNETVYTISDPAGFSYTVSTKAALTDADVQILKSVITTLTGWKLLKISHAKVVVNGAHEDVLVIPSSFVYKNVDLSKYMPSGIQFYYDKFLQYDFRMYKDNLFLRLKGQVYDEKEFADRLYSAVENPVLFLQTNNPQYLLQRLNDLASKIDSLNHELVVEKQHIDSTEQKLVAADATLSKALSAEFNGKLNNLETKGQALADNLVKRQEAVNNQQRSINAKQQQMNAEQRSINAKQAAVNDKQHQVNTAQGAVNKNVEKQLADIKDQHSSTASVLDTVRYALLVLNNRGFFGKIYPIKKEDINRVVAMKRADSSLTVDQVLAKLKTDGVKMSKKEVSLIFGVYFNEFK